MSNRYRSNCFTFLTDGYAFIRLVGVLFGLILLPVAPKEDTPSCELGQKHCSKVRHESKTKNKMPNSVDPDEMAR